MTLCIMTLGKMTLSITKNSIIKLGKMSANITGFNKNIVKLFKMKSSITKLSKMRLNLMKLIKMKTTKEIKLSITTQQNDAQYNYHQHSDTQH